MYNTDRKGQVLPSSLWGQVLGGERGIGEDARNSLLNRVQAQSEAVTSLGAHHKHCINEWCDFQTGGLRLHKGHALTARKCLSQPTPTIPELGQRKEKPMLYPAEVYKMNYLDPHGTFPSQ